MIYWTASLADYNNYEDQLSSLTHNHHLPLKYIFYSSWASLRMHTILISMEEDFTILEAIKSMLTAMIRQELVKEETKLISHPVCRIKMIRPAVCLIVCRFALAFRIRYPGQPADRVPIDPQSSICSYCPLL